MITPEESAHWRRRLLITEFLSLAILIGSMAALSQNADANQQTITLDPLWLLIPALSSLTLFVSFLGLMYLRWVVAASAERLKIHKVIFSLLAATLLGVWAYGIANTWSSLSASF